MDVYTAKIQIQKLLEHVEGIADSRPKMYKKSKERWKEIADMCGQVVKVISQIVREGALESDEDNFEGSVPLELLQTLRDMQSELSGLRQFVTYSPDNPVIETSSTSLTTATKIPNAQRKAMLNEYLITLRSYQTTPSEYVQVDECARLLYKWFEHRFFKSIETSPQFRYNIRRIPTWIYDIVLAYSKHLMLGTVDQFVEDFDNWCDSLLVSPCRFAVPYDIYKIDNDLKSEDVTLVAAVLWDMLIDSGLSNICKNDDYGLYLSESAIYDICKEKNFSVLDHYANYKCDPSIILRCNIQKFRSEVI